MIEDEIYRTSSQYRLWSYTSARLAAVRGETNSVAAGKVKAAFRRARAANAATNQADEDGDGSKIELEIDTLTVDEELKIIQWGCSKIMEIGEAMKPRIPPNIVATAIQYLRRFYLTNSPMTYHPKQIMLCALFLATKSEHFYISLHNFVSELPGVTEDDIRAPEFLLTQGLRFTLDVRHPMRGLEGGVAEMLTLAENGHLSIVSGQNAKQRVGPAADRAKQLLRSAAQMTDVYFLFTPAQIWLAALWVSDQRLTAAYIGQIFGRLGSDVSPVRERLVETVSACADILQSYKSPEDDKATRTEVSRIGKKLKKCQDPEKTDIVAVTKAKAAEKREGNDRDEKTLKKRKLEQERLKSDGAVFGGDLNTATGTR